MRFNPLSYPENHTARYHCQIPAAWWLERPWCPGPEAIGKMLGCSAFFWYLKTKRRTINILCLSMGFNMNSEPRIVCNRFQEIDLQERETGRNGKSQESYCHQLCGCPNPKKYRSTAQQMRSVVLAQVRVFWHRIPVLIIAFDLTSGAAPFHGIHLECMPCLLKIEPPICQCQKPGVTQKKNGTHPKQSTTYGTPKNHRFTIQTWQIKFHVWVW